MPRDPFEEYRQVLKATEPEKIDALPPSELRRYYKLLSTHAQSLKNFGPDVHERWLRRLEEVRDAMQAKRHEQTHGIDSETLCWTKVAAVAAILAVIATVVLGILQIWLSSTGTSKAGRASPRSLPQTTATISESPEPAAGSNSATPSPKPLATVNPSVPPQ